MRRLRRWRMKVRKMFYVQKHHIDDGQVANVEDLMAEMYDVATACADIDSDNINHDAIRYATVYSPSDIATCRESTSRTHDDVANVLFKEVPGAVTGLDSDTFESRVSTWYSPTSSSDPDYLTLAFTLNTTTTLSVYGSGTWYLPSTLQEACDFLGALPVNGQRIGYTAGYAFVVAGAQSVPYFVSASVVLPPGPVRASFEVAQRVQDSDITGGFVNCNIAAIGVVR